MKRNTIIIGAVVIVIVIALVIFGVNQFTASAATTVRVQTATVTRGNIVATVSAAGNVSAPDDAVMAFQQSGRVAKVNVQVGDLVKKDQVLMELDTTDLDLALKTAKSNLASQQANFDASKANLQFALRTAQSNLANSQAALDAAKAKTAQNPNQLIVSKVALDKASIALQTAQANYNTVAWRPDVGMTTQAQALQSATIDYNSALANYNITVSSLNDTSALKSAQTQVDRDQVSLEQAQKNLDTSARTAQAQLDSAQVALDQAQRNLDKTRITAPFDGVVAAVNYSVGDTASGTAVTIVDMKNLQIKVTIAEVDVAKIAAGQTAQLTMDALTGKTYNAKVLSIGPVATVTQGVVNYPVTLAVTDADSAVKPGMTANVAIAVEQRNNVLLVPIRAVRTQGTNKTVSVQYKGQTIAAPVITGLSNDTNIEITNGLNEGDQVVLTQTTTRQTGGGGGFLFGGGGPGGR